MKKMYTWKNLFDELQGLSPNCKICLFLIFMGMNTISCAVGYSFALFFGVNPGIEGIALLCGVGASGAFMLLAR